jgi:DNA-binding NarL/FixJ family response regulator
VATNTEPFIGHSSGERKHPLSQPSTSKPEPKIRLLLLHARVLFRMSLAHLLAEDFDLSAECANTHEALEIIARSVAGERLPDLILFDFGVCQELIPAVRAAGYQGKLLAIVDEIDPAACARALGLGLSGVVRVADPPARLVQAIRIVNDGGSWVDQSVIQLLAGRYPAHEDLRLDALGEREQAVLRGILGGMSNRKIAEQIGVSEGTVKATLQQLFDRTGVRTRSQLVRIMLAGPGVH